MPASTTISAFHQWILSDPKDLNSACTLVLHMPDQQPSDSLIRKIADYLNEYDDGEMRWLAATAELVKAIAEDPHNSKLLGITGELSDSTFTETWQQALTNIGRRGHVILSSPPSHRLELDPASTFHAGVGARGEISEECHITLNPRLIDLPCIAQIIGDVFLEWLHWEDVRPQSIQNLRP